MLKYFKCWVWELQQYTLQGSTCSKNSVICWNNRKISLFMCVWRQGDANCSLKKSKQSWKIRCDVTSQDDCRCNEVRAARVFVWSLRSARSPAHFPLSLPLFPLAQVLISQPQDQRRSLAISQREPLIPHRSTRDTAAPWTPYEAPQSSPARREGKRASREKKSFKGGDVCIFFSLARAESSSSFAAGHETMRLEPVLIKRAFPPFNSGARQTSRQRRAIDN